MKEELVEKGVCRLTLVPVRSAPAHKSELVTQILFGDHYQVLERDKDDEWLKIKIAFDGYQGWMQQQQHSAISEEYFTQIGQSDFHITLDHFSQILVKNEYINVLLGSVIPITSGELFADDTEFSFKGSSKPLSEKWSFEQIKEVAVKFLNAPYLWGGKTAMGIDCSGFVQQTFKICGYHLKRDASLQVAQGSEVASIDVALAGDLAFFGNSDDKIDHVGIILGSGEIIHASGVVRIDKIDQHGIINADSKKYTHELKGIRRIIKLGRECWF
ncbi:MAG: NlpC/P60 family protein [Cyclobacteriaceae bacterium]